MQAMDERRRNAAKMTIQNLEHLCCYEPVAAGVADEYLHEIRPTKNSVQTARSPMLSTA